MICIVFPHQNRVWSTHLLPPCLNPHSQKKKKKLAESTTGLRDHSDKRTSCLLKSYLISTAHVFLFENILIRSVSSTRLLVFTSINFYLHIFSLVKVWSFSSFRLVFRFYLRQFFRSFPPTQELICLKCRSSGRSKSFLSPRIVNRLLNTKR